MRPPVGIADRGTYAGAVGLRVVTGEVIDAQTARRALGAGAVPMVDEWQGAVDEGLGDGDPTHARAAGGGTPR
jgi:hypothetical protein